MPDPTFLSLQEECVPLVREKLHNEAEGTAPATKALQAQLQQAFIGGGGDVQEPRGERSGVFRDLPPLGREGRPTGSGMEVPRQRSLPEEEGELPFFPSETMCPEASSAQEGLQLTRQGGDEECIPGHDHGRKVGFSAVRGNGTLDPTWVYQRSPVCGSQGLLGRPGEGFDTLWRHV